MVVGDDISVVGNNNTGTCSSLVGFLVFALLWGNSTVTEEITEKFCKRVTIGYLVGFAHFRYLDVHNGINTLFGSIGEVDITYLRNDSDVSLGLVV